MTTAPKPRALHIESPLIFSAILSQKSGANVYLKLDNTQPSGSFKNRGIGHLSLHAFTLHGPSAFLVTSSGGNAGLAMAYSALQLGCKALVVVPVTASAVVVDRLRNVYGARVEIFGESWIEADGKAREEVAKDPNAVYIPPFDDPLVVEGHSTLVEEIERQLPNYTDRKPDAIICSVGGGGLMAGIITGLERDAYFENTSLLALESFGCDSLHASLSASFPSTSSLPNPTLVALPKITSICNSLGAKQVSKQALEKACEWSSRGKKGEVVSVSVEDKRCLEITRSFANDHTFILEPSSSISLSPIYYPSILQSALPHLTFSEPGKLPPKSAPVIIVEVCGGNMRLDTFKEWEDKFEGKESGKVRVWSAGGGEREVKV